MIHITKNLCETHLFGSTEEGRLVGTLEILAFRTMHTRLAGHSDARYGREFVPIWPESSLVDRVLRGARPPDSLVWTFVQLSLPPTLVARAWPCKCIA
jgi:hypothetical protein